MKNPLVSIVVVNWNGLSHLEKLLPTLEKVKYSPFEVIIVDNASVDESVAFVKKNFPKYNVVNNAKNEGFAKGNNIGVQHAKGEYILFLNNDTQVTPDFLSTLVKVIQNSSKLGIVQPKILLLDRKDTLDSIGSFLTSTGFLNHYGFEEKDIKSRDKKIYLFSAKGACFLMRKELFNRVGGFDDDYVNYFEETDLCWRVWLSGYKILYIPEAKIYHKGWGSSTRLGLYTVTYHSFKNRINCLLKNLSFINLLKIIPLHIATCIFISLVYAFIFKFSNTFGIYNAVFWNIRNLPSTLAKRSKVQNEIRRVSDSNIYKHIFRDKGFKYYFMILYTSIIRSVYLKKSKELESPGYLRLLYKQGKEVKNPGYKFFDTSYHNYRTKNYFLDNWQIAYLKRIFFNLKLSAEDTFLDIGVGGSGWTVIEAVRSGVKKGIGIDIDTTLMKHAKDVAKNELDKSKINRCKFITADAVKLPFKNNEFTKVCSIALLEHIKDFRKAINEMSRVTKKDGLVFVCVPNTYKRTPLLLKPLNKFNDQHVGHFHHFTPRYLSKEFKKYGFEEEKLIYHSHSIKLFQWLLTYVSPRFNKESSRIWWFLEKIETLQEKNPNAMNFSVVFKKIR